MVHCGGRVPKDFLRMKLSNKVMGIGILILSLLIITITAMAAVDLLYFLAESGTGHVLLKWETASELNNAGYYVTRSLDIAGPFLRITGFIPARGDGITGAYYEYFDTNAVIATNFYYFLEM